MSRRIAPLAAALTLTLLAPVSARAAELTAVHGVKTVGALTLETQGLATNDVLVHRQGGFAVPGAVQWIRTPVDQQPIKQAAF